MTTVSTTVQTVSVSSQGGTVTVANNPVTATIASAVVGPQGPEAPRSVSILEPFTGERFSLFYNESAKTISSFIVATRGGSATIQIKQAATLDGVGTSLLSSTVVNSSTPATVAPTDASILTNNYVFIEIDSASGGLAELSVVINY